MVLSDGKNRWVKVSLEVLGVRMSVFRVEGAKHFKHYIDALEGN